MTRDHLEHLRLALRVADVVEQRVEQDPLAKRLLLDGAFKGDEDYRDVKFVTRVFTLMGRHALEAPNFEVTRDAISGEAARHFVLPSIRAHVQRRLTHCEGV